MGKQYYRLFSLAAGILFLAVMFINSAPAPADLPFETYFATFQQGVNGYFGASDTYIDNRHDRGVNNYGAVQWLSIHGGAIVDGQNVSQRGFVKFDDIVGSGGVPADVTEDEIISAVLTITMYSNTAPAATDRSLRISPMLTPWEAGSSAGAAADGETTAQYRFFREDGDYAAGDYWGDTGSQVTYPVSGVDIGDRITSVGPWEDRTGGSGNRGEYGWAIDVDVTETVKAWFNGTMENHGFYLDSMGCWWASYGLYSSNWEDDPEWRPKLTIEYIPEPSSLLLLGVGSLLALMRRRR